MIQWFYDTKVLVLSSFFCLFCFLSLWASVNALSLILFIYFWRITFINQGSAKNQETQLKLDDLIKSLLETLYKGRGSI